MSVLKKKKVWLVAIFTNFIVRDPVQSTFSYKMPMFFHIHIDLDRETAPYSVFTLIKIFQFNNAYFLHNLFHSVGK